MEAYNELKEGERGAWTSIIAYIALSALKLWIGYTAGSSALTADGLNNTTDLVASIAVLIGLRISRRPPDKDHPYGHFRAETVAALVASFIMFAVGIQVFIGAVRSFGAPVIETPDMIAAWTALACAAVMYGVYLYNIRLARKINNKALTAAAYDNRSDAYVSLAAFAGILGAQMGLPWLDPCTALLVAILICKTAWGIFIDASHALTDGFDDTKLESFKNTVAETPGVESIEDLRARVHGNQVLVDVVIVVDHRLNVAESHDIAEHVEKRMFNKHKVGHVHVHIEPSSS
ncbi:cation diffusion facilitator family transporter [Paenibacillus sp. FJAT-26967]|uniref:cation diffusion facilitator family transporter n=1 Tax=Paenibacillus sp. FJAT-26967 TaxID=1729690 RepID=UPI000838978B|nr:cation diffusion facilitator family transporter [Paenibacillus sp. FJAT-26967]